MDFEHRDKDAAPDTARGEVGGVLDVRVVVDTPKEERWAWVLLHGLLLQ